MKPNNIIVSHHLRLFSPNTVFVLAYQNINQALQVLIKSHSGKLSICLPQVFMQVHVDAIILNIYGVQQLK